MLKVPFVSQWELETAPPAGSSYQSLPGETWARRSCAIACLTMVLNYWGVKVTLADVLRSALEAGGWDARRCWMHAPLVEVLARHGLVACRRNWRLLDGREAQYLAGRSGAGSEKELGWVREQMLNEGLTTLKALLQAGVPAVASVYRPFGRFDGPGHQIVIVGADPEALVYHDPAEPQGQGCVVAIAVFMRNWKGTALLAAPEGHSALDPAYPAGPLTPSTG